MIGIIEAITAGSSLINGVIDRVFPNPSDVEKQKIERLKLEIDRELEIIKTQTEINQQEAKHPSLLVSGWRPLTGYVCGISLAYVSILEPILRFTATVGFDYSGEFPVINTDLTMQILIGMLGLSGIRGLEKAKGVARNNLKE